MQNCQNHIMTLHDNTGIVLMTVLDLLARPNYTNQYEVCLVLFGVVWYCLVLLGIVWHCLVLFGIVRYCLLLFGVVWYCKKMRHYSSNLSRNIYGKKGIVYRAKKMVFGHYSYQLDTK